MAYKTVRDSSTLQEILSRAAGKVTAEPPVIYSSSDIQRARSVLDRLLLTASKVEVSRIRALPKQLEET